MNDIWLEKYRPKEYKDYFGNQEHIEVIKEWIENFERQDKNFLILYGIPGIGKTTLAHLIFNYYNYEIIEINTSEYRSKKFINDKIGVLGKHSIVFKNNNDDNNQNQVNNDDKDNKQNYLKTGLIMDEIDGITTYAENSGIAELQKLILKRKNNRFPIICTCNSIKNKKIKDLCKYSISIQLEKPSISNLVKLAKKIVKKEKIDLNKEQINDLASSCFEYRELINKLYQIYVSKEKNHNQYINAIKDDNKDKEIQFLDNTSSQLKFALLNDISLENIYPQIEASTNVFVLNIYINIFKILNLYKKNKISNENYFQKIQILNNNLIDIDKFHNKLFIYHYWDLNDYMIYILFNSISLLKNTKNYFNNLDITQNIKLNTNSKSNESKLKNKKQKNQLKKQNQENDIFKSNNFILDHHNSFNQMSQNQSIIKKRRKAFNYKYKFNSIQSMYYLGLIQKTKETKNKKKSKKSSNKNKDKNLELDHLSKLYTKITDYISN